MHEMPDNDEINLKEKKEKAQETIQHIKRRLKDPKFYIDNLILIALIIIVTYYGIKGHYIDTKVIEICNGIPIP